MAHQLLMLFTMKSTEQMAYQNSEREDLLVSDGQSAGRAIMTKRAMFLLLFALYAGTACSSEIGIFELVPLKDIDATAGRALDGGEAPAAGPDGGPAAGPDAGPDAGLAAGSDGGPDLLDHLTCPYSFNKTGREFYVDPILGDQGNDGSQSRPWKSLQAVIDDYVDCTDQNGVPHHDNAPVKGGDTILLVGRDGHDRSLEITGCFNTDYVSIKSQVRHEAQLTSVYMKGGAYWEFDGIAFEKNAGASIIRAVSHNHRGPAHHLSFLNNTFTSGDHQTKQDYVDTKDVGGIRLQQANHSRVLCNHMYKIGQGLVASGDHIDVLYNTIEFFSRDAIVNGGDYNRYLYNRVYDSVKLNDGHHDDFFQSHRGVYPDTSTGLEIGYNILVNRYSNSQPTDTMGATQCLSAFGDGPKTQIHLFNNVCKTDHYHGISWRDTHDSVVVNNTVIGGSNFPGYANERGFTPTVTWMQVSGSGNIVQNNLVSRNNSGGDHNIEITPDQVEDWFVDWAGGDLTLKPDAPAVNAGVPDNAPPDDLLGQPRDSQPDIGAYEVQP